MKASRAGHPASRLPRAVRLAGTGVSPGVALGTALVVQDHDEEAVVFREVPAKSLKQEVARLGRAFETARDELQELKDKVSLEVGAERARIFEAQMYMLQDDALWGESARAIEREHVNAEWALRETRDRLINRFRELGEESFRDRFMDIKDATRRVARRLAGAEPARSPAGTGIVIVAAEITPSEAATLDTGAILAFVTEAGGRTSHTAILAKSLGIPAIVGAKGATAAVRTGDWLLVDGRSGMVLVAPEAAEIREYQRQERTRVKHEKLLRKQRFRPSRTLDGRKVFLQANIELPEEVDAAIGAGAEGIGLYRTEFLYLSQKEGREPAEDEQYAVYRRIAERVKPYSAIIRTLDLGGEKLMRLEGTHADKRAASMLGLRALRLCLARTDLFRTQLRALLRASAHGRVKIMFPFVTSADELREAKAILKDCMAELRREKERFNDALEIGAMIEVPAAAMTADLLAREVNFFSIGTNDLIQYMLAVNRADETVAHLYEPLHPALLRTISRVIECAHGASVKVGMCGEMAADPLLTPLLVGLGLDELSMDGKSLPAVKHILRNQSYAECQQLAHEALAMEAPAGVRRLLHDFLSGRIPRWLLGEDVGAPPA